MGSYDQNDESKPKVESKEDHKGYHDVNMNDSQQPPQSSQSDKFYLKCLTLNPRIEGSGVGSSYVTYQIDVETNLPIFQKKKFSVRRRFTDFALLYSILVLEYPTIAVPSLPPKAKIKYLKGDRFDPEFLIQRCSSLNRFLERISLHHVLCRSNSVSQFLESNDWNLSYHAIVAKASASVKYNKPLTIRSVADEESSHQTSSQQAASNTIAAKFDGLSDALINAFGKPNEPNEQFVKFTEALDAQRNGLGLAEKRISHLENYLKSMADELKRLVIPLEGLSDLDASYSVQTRGFKDAIKKFSSELDTIHQFYKAELGTFFTDTQMYIKQFNNLIKARDQRQMDLEGLNEYLKRYQSERSDLEADIKPQLNNFNTFSIKSSASYVRNAVEDICGVDKQQVKKDRLKTLEYKIKELESECELAKEIVQTYDKDIIQEYEILNAIYAKQMKDILYYNCHAHINFYEKLLAAWSEPSLCQ